MLLPSYLVCAFWKAFFVAQDSLIASRVEKVQLLVIASAPDALIFCVLQAVLLVAWSSEAQGDGGHQQHGDVADKTAWRPAQKPGAKQGERLQ